MSARVCETRRIFNTSSSLLCPALSLSLVKLARGFLVFTTRKNNSERHRAIITERIIARGREYRLANVKKKFPSNYFRCQYVRNYMFRMFRLEIKINASLAVLKLKYQLSILGLRALIAVKSIRRTVFKTVLLKSANIRVPLIFSVTPLPPRCSLPAIWPPF